MPPGVTGTLLSRAFLDRRLPGWPGVAAADPRDRARVAAVWAAAHAACGPATSLRTLMDRVAAPIASLLGFTLASPARLSDILWTAALTSEVASIPLVLIPWNASLDSAWRDAVRLGLSAGAFWCLIANGPRLRLIDALPHRARRHLDFDLEAAADDERTASALTALLAPARFARPADSAALEAMVAASDRDGRFVCAALRTGVREAIEQIASGLVPPRARTDAVRLAAAHDEALTAVYRLLFLLFAEARGLVPIWHPVYRGAYSIEALRDQAEAGDTAGLWEGFQAVWRLAHRGCDAGDLRVTAFNGRLFAPGRTPRLAAARIEAARVQHAILALSNAPSARGDAQQRIGYRDLGVEELGSIYETLLDFEPRPSKAPEPRAAGGPPPIGLVRSGRERKQTGSFYTPEPLTRHLVQRALAPLVAGRRPDEILELRVLDPAMGSGAFLVAACRYLAGAYEAALVRTGTCAAGDLTDSDRAAFRRLIAQRCLFGVDLNPAAVHLARLSLWLTTLAADRPLSFLDHRLLAGNSLAGAIAWSDLVRHPPGRAASRVRAGAEAQLPLFDPDEWHDAVRGWLPVRRLLAFGDEITPADVKGKEAALARLTSSETWRRARALLDLWCAAWIAGMSRAEFHGLAEHVAKGDGAIGARPARAALGAASEVAERVRCFHWTLAFPEVFCEPDGRERSDAGFDAVIGNPPWEMLRAEGESGRDRFEATLRFVRGSGAFPARSDGHPNLYQLFLERAVRLLRRGGRLGLVVPHGFASDHGAARLRNLLLRDCALDTLVGFENRAGIFPIHRGLRFLLMSATSGQPSGEIKCVFGLHDAASLDVLEERPAHAYPLRLTTALLERVSGPGLQIPELRGPLDLEILDMLASRHRPLDDPAGWGAAFGRELNATDDRRHFSTGGGGLPVIEGKHLAPFVVDVAGATLRVPRDIAARLLEPARTFGRRRLAFRDVSSATNRLTLIAALVPAGCVTTHTVSCLRTLLSAADQWLLCALLNSYVANFLIRQRVSSHVSVATIARLPVPRPARDDVTGQRLAACGRALAARGGRDVALGAEAQALAARAYGIGPRMFRHVLSTFPLVPDSERGLAWSVFNGYASDEADERRAGTS